MLKCKVSAGQRRCEEDAPTETQTQDDWTCLSVLIMKQPWKTVKTMNVAEIDYVLSLHCCSRLHVRIAMQLTPTLSRGVSHQLLCTFCRLYTWGLAGEGPENVRRISGVQSTSESSLGNSALYCLGKTTHPSPTPTTSLNTNAS